MIMGPYWESLPKQGNLNTKETFPRSSLSLLQDDPMVCCLSAFSCLNARLWRAAPPSPQQSASHVPHPSMSWP